MSRPLCRYVALATLLLGLASLAHAADGGPQLGFVFEADLEYGGDDVATISFTDGSSQDLKAGQGFTLGSALITELRRIRPSVSERQVTNS